MILVESHAEIGKDCSRILLFTHSCCQAESFRIALYGLLIVVIILRNQAYVMQNDTTQVIVWLPLQGRRTFKALACLVIFSAQTHNLALIRQSHGFTLTISDLLLCVQCLFKIVFALFIFSDPSVKHGHMASD